MLWREATRALLRHKLRSGLTMLGITIGITAVVLVVAIGQAGKQQAEEALSQLGDNLVWVEAGSRNVAGVRTGTHGMTNLTIEDARAIVTEVPMIKRMSPQVDGNVRVAFGNQNWMTRFRGETPAYLEIKKWQVAEGRSFTDEDVEQQNNVVLIGQTVKQQVFGAQNAVGQLVRMSGQLFEVVGVLTGKGQSTDGRDQDDWLLLPYTTAHTKLRGRGPMFLDDILCSATSANEVNTAIDRIVPLLRERHQLLPGDENDFNIRRPDEVLKAGVQASDALARLLMTVASIALLVGGIGIMNVMLASISERVREIGVRRALGAKRSDILTQILAESLTLAVGGGLFGMIASIGLIKILQQVVVAANRPELSPAALAIGVLFSGLVGVLAGLYPAFRASRIPVVEALRTD